MAQNSSSIAGKLLDIFVQLSDQSLPIADLAHLSETACFSYKAGKAAMARRFLPELLRCVFNAEPQNIEKIFKSPVVEPGIVLKKTRFLEGNDSQKLGKFVCVRSWKSVSPLQAAALSLDSHLIIKLLGYIVRDNNLRLDAQQQLREVYSRIRVALTPTHNDEHKEAAEARELLADNDAYGAPIMELIQAYLDFLEEDPQSDRDVFKVLWKKVCACQKKLPRYVLQEFFGSKTWGGRNTNFHVEPPRGDLRYDDGVGGGELFDLGDDSGSPSAGSPRSGCVRGLHSLFPCERGGAFLVRHDKLKQRVRNDQETIEFLFESRLQDLNNILEMLETPETAITLADGTWKESCAQRRYEEALKWL